MNDTANVRQIRAELGAARSRLENALEEIEHVHASGYALSAIETVLALIPEESDDEGESGTTDDDVVDATVLPPDNVLAKAYRMVVDDQRPTTGPLPLLLCSLIERAVELEQRHARSQERR